MGNQLDNHTKITKTFSKRNLLIVTGVVKVPVCLAALLGAQYPMLSVLDLINMRQIFITCVIVVTVVAALAVDIFMITIARKKGQRLGFKDALFTNFVAAVSWGLVFLFYAYVAFCRFFMSSCISMIPSFLLWVFSLYLAAVILTAGVIGIIQKTKGLV